MEKVKELYYRAYSTAMERGAAEQVAYVVVQYARYLAFKCADPNRAVDVINQAIAKCSSGGSSRGTKTLYLSYVNFLKHLEGVIPDTYTKIVAIFEKGIDLTAGGLSEDDRQEVARFFLEYLQEYCQSVSFLRATEATLKARGLINNSKPKATAPEFSVSQLGNEIQKDQGAYGGSRDTEDGKITGKRQYQVATNGDNYTEGDEVEKRVRQ